MIQVISWLWAQPNGRTSYTSEHVNIWADSVSRNLDMDHEVAIVTDMPEGIDPRQKFIGSDQAWISHVLGWGEKTWGPEDGVVWWDSQRNHLAPDWRVMFFPGTPKPWDVTSDAWVELNWRRSDLWDEAAQMARKRNAAV